MIEFQSDIPKKTLLFMLTCLLVILSFSINSISINSTTTSRIQEKYYGFALTKIYLTCNCNGVCSDTHEMSTLVYLNLFSTRQLCIVQCFAFDSVLPGAQALPSA